jgi:glutathione S-transferase
VPCENTTPLAIGPRTKERCVLTIYGRTNSVNVQKVLWCLAELGVPYTRIDAGLAHGKNNEPWYLALNPNGRIPLLVDGEFTLWESNTIVRYLAGKHGLGSLCPVSLETRALAERWMDWQLSTLVEPVSAVFQNLYRRKPSERDSQDAIEREARKANRALTILDAHLERHAFVAGSGFTMGDIPVGATAHRWLEIAGIERPPFAAVRAWRARLETRSGFREHVQLPLS